MAKRLASRVPGEETNTMTEETDVAPHLSERWGSALPHIERFIEASSGGGRHAGRSAIRHIRRAWALKDIDKEMAAFRGITAEEESVRAIFHALQKRRYPGASCLKWRDHRQKAAVDPFFRAVSQVLEELAN
ncbi:MAG: hypothetical protein AB1725_12115, partial [Armatimonadota bacterium]